jgi:dihydroorotate dehydrogenase electron transfer subunit
MSICKNTNTTICIVYRVVGQGSNKLSTLKPNDNIDTMIDLGNNFTYQSNYGKPLIVAGGLGLGSVFNLAVYFKNNKIPFDIICGFKTKADVFYVKEIKQLNSNAIISTDDGTYGEKGNIIQIINKYH